MLNRDRRPPLSWEELVALGSDLASKLGPEEHEKYEKERQAAEKQKEAVENARIERIVNERVKVAIEEFLAQREEEIRQELRKDFRYVMNHAGLGQPVLDSNGRRRRNR